MNWIQPHGTGVVLQVKVVPRATSNQVVGLLGDALKIRLQAPPVDGKANRALVLFLSRALGIPRARVSVLAGISSRTKRVLVEGLDVEAVRKALEPA